MSEIPSAARPERRIRGLLVVALMAITLAALLLLVVRTATPSGGFSFFRSDQTYHTVRSFALADRDGLARHALQLEAAGQHDVNVLGIRVVVFNDENRNAAADPGEIILQREKTPEQPERLLTFGPTTLEWDAGLVAPMLEYEIQFSHGQVVRQTQPLRPAAP